MGEEPAPEQVDDENRENAADCGRQSQQSLSRTEVLNDTVEQQLESRGVRVGDDALSQDLHGGIERALPPALQLVVPQRLILQAIEPQHGSQQENEGQCQNGGTLPGTSLIHGPSS